MSEPAKYFLKTALTRWQKELSAGNLPSLERARIGLPARKKNLDDRTIRKVREKMYGASTDLTPDQLERHRELNDRIYDQLRRRYATEVGSQSKGGPAFSDVGQVFMHKDPTAQLVKGYGPQEKERAMRGRGAYNRAVLHHELGEAAMQEGTANWAKKVREQPGVTLTPAQEKAMQEFQVFSAQKAKKYIKGKKMPGLDKVKGYHLLSEPNAPLQQTSGRTYEPRQMGSHMGVYAPAAEMEHVHRDPDAFNLERRVFAGRGYNAGDREFWKRWKQYGGTQAAPLPVGGRAIRTMDEHFATQATNLGAQARKPRRAIPNAPMAGRENADQRIQHTPQDATALFSSIRRDSQL